MPVHKFRSIEDMKRGGTWRDPGTPELLRSIALVWDFGRRTAASRFPPGVYRHRNVESLNALTDRWAAERFRAKRQPGAPSSPR